MVNFISGLSIKSLVSVYDCYESYVANMPVCLIKIKKDKCLNSHKGDTNKNGWIDPLHPQFNQNGSADQ